MSGAPSTCWTVIRGAAAGDQPQRAHFVVAYSPVIRAYLRARWQRSPLLQSVEDATQDVLLACLREGGVLGRADPERPGGFRPFLYGVVRNVARDMEKARSRRREIGMEADVAEVLPSTPEGAPDRAFERAWATAVVKAAVDAQRRRAEAEGPEAVRRIEILRMRFEDGLPVREIADRWGADAAHIHREYAKARREFESALVDEMLFHHPGPRARARDEARELLASLGRA